MKTIFRSTGRLVLGLISVLTVSEGVAWAQRASDVATEVTVAGTREEQTGGSAHIIKERQLLRFRHDDPQRVLLTVPGVYVRQEDGVGLRPNIGMRGVSSDRSKKVTLMEDGILFAPAPYSAPAAYYFPLMARITGVNVIKGPSAIVFGPSTIGGAIDLKTAPIPSEPKGMVDLSMGEYGYRKAHVRYGQMDDRFGLSLEGVHLGSSGFKQLDGGGDTGFVRNEWTVKGRWVVDPTAAQRNEIEIKAGYSDEESNETYLGLTDKDFRAAPYRRYRASHLDRMAWHRTNVAVTHRAFLAPGASLVTTAYRNDLERTWRKVNGFSKEDLVDVLRDRSAASAPLLNALRGNANLADVGGGNNLLIGPNQRTFVSQGLQTVITWSPATGPVHHRFEYGFRLHYDSIRRNHTESPFDLVEGNPVAITPPNMLNARTEQTTTSNFDRSYAMAIHLVDTVTWGSWTVTPGVRAELIQSRATDNLTGREDVSLQQVVLPGAGLHYQLTRYLGLLAGVYEGFSPVPPGQTSRARPERSTNYETGVRYHREKFRAEIIGFYNNYRNLTNVCGLLCGVAFQDVQVDGGKARVRGVEGYVESELRLLDSLSLPGRLAYTFTDATFLSDINSDDPIFGQVRRGYAVPYVPRHQVAASLGAETKRWGANGGVTYVTALYEQAADPNDQSPSLRTDTTFLLDASLSYRPLPWLTVYLKGTNLLDRAYLASRRPFGARPGAPRWVQAGMRADF